MRWLLVASLLASVGRAGAEPELGRSTKGHVWWDEPLVAVTPILVKYKHDRWAVQGWQASVDGVPIDRDRFYALVGRSELARAAKSRRVLGAVATVAGVAVAALTARGAWVEGRGRDLALFYGGTAVSLVGAYVVVFPDPTSVEEAQQLASGRRLVVGLGTKF